LPATPALRREQIRLQVALITPLIHVKGYAAPETKAAAERAHVLIEQAEGFEEPPEDPLLLFSVLYGFWAANYVAFNGDAVRELAEQFRAVAEKQGTTAPLLTAHRVMGISLLQTGDIAESRKHFDRATALYDPAEHRPLATRFSVDARVSILSFRAWALWLLGYPEAALVDADHALEYERKIGQAATLMVALHHASFTHIHCGNYGAANAEAGELVALTDEKGAKQWKAGGMLVRAWLFAVAGKTSDAVQMLTSGITAWRSTGSTVFMPWFLSLLARAYAGLSQFDDAWRCIAKQ
jgi:predicted ATPase